MSGFAKLTVKGSSRPGGRVRGPAPRWTDHQGQADRDLGGGEHSAPLGRSGMEMPDSGQLDEGGTPSRSRPPADLAGSSSSLARLSRGASGYGSVGVYRRDLQKKKLLHYRGARITPAGREILAELQGVKEA